MTDSKSDPKTPAKHGLVNYTHPDTFGNWLGYTVTVADKVKHTAETELQIREDHLSPAGRVHGGVISAFFDYACGAACFTTLGPKDFCSTVELKVNYLRPVELGDFLVARTQVVHRGKRLCVLQGLMVRTHARGAKLAAEESVALATATFNIVTPKG